MSPQMFGTHEFEERRAPKIRKRGRGLNSESRARMAIMYLLAPLGEGSVQIRERYKGDWGMKYWHVVPLVVQICHSPPLNFSVDPRH